MDDREVVFCLLAPVGGHFAIGQSIFALPLLAIADALERGFAPEILRKAIGRNDTRFIDTIEAPAIFAVSAYAPAVSGVLVGIFYLFERRLGASRRASIAAAALLGATTYVAAQSVYFLQRTSETVAILGGFLALHAWRHTGSVAWLAAGCGLAASVILIRVPAALALPALAGYGVSTLIARSRAHELAWSRIAAAIALPVAAVAAIHVAVNQAKWGYWIESPKIAQRALLGGSLREGALGLVFSPGAGLFAYSPLLLLVPLWLPGFWRAHRAECATVIAIAASLVYVCGRFIWWHGLWSAPGPRYLFALTPLLLLPLGPWLDRPRPPWQRVLTGVLAAIGGVFQLALVSAPWRGTIQRLGFLDLFATGQYPSLDFLFDPQRSPIAMHLRGLAAGEVDVWLWALWSGVGREPQRDLAGALLGLWALLFGLCLYRLRRCCRGS